MGKTRMKIRFENASGDWLVFCLYGDVNDGVSLPQELNSRTLDFMGICRERAFSCTYVQYEIVTELKMNA